MVRASVRSMRRGDMALNEVDKREDTIVVEEDGGLFGSLGSKHLFLFCGARRQVVNQAGPIAKWARLWRDEVDAGKQPDIPEDMSNPERAERLLRKLLCEVVEQADLCYVTVEAKPTEEVVPKAHRETYWGRSEPFGFMYGFPFLCGYKKGTMCQAFGWPKHEVVNVTERGEVSDYFKLPNRLREAMECPMEREDLLVFQTYVAAVYLQHIFSTVQYYRKELVVEDLYNKMCTLREIIEADLVARYGKSEGAEL
ncbi:hypothetical protein FBEOM_14610 [Fusarium beomiforme]|uniref:Uncharacterized protein n=1 Tax=Fusarium beomiforme TaxID=44412 RepID=A0A9P5DKT9_9HYPO|nr:hypothetical protein FBEOM_14610 [Fusarium beomiforme]